jgi:hypothetical protein
VILGIAIAERGASRGRVVDEESRVDAHT